MLAPNALYIVSQKAAYGDWHRRVVYLPMLVVVGVGVAISNSQAVLEALFGKQSEFVRTPKRGDRPIKHYGISFPWLALVELGLGCYCAFSLNHYLMAGKYLVGPFLAIYTFGFLFVGALTLVHRLKPQR